MESENCLELAQLLPNEILEIILGFSDFESVKTFRLVCRRWNCAAQLYLPNVSTLCLSPTEKKNFDDFNATFESALTDFPFSSFKLKCEENTSLSWNNTELEKFLEKWRDAIKSLEFDKVKINIRDDDGTRFLRRYELCPILQSGLETLIINCFKATSISVAVCHLTSIKVIKLSYGVILNYDKETKLTPTIIELRNIIYRKYYVHLNDFIDFSQAKRVCFHQTIPENAIGPFPKLISLTMTNGITLDELDLRQIEIYEMHNANWEIKRLFSLSRIPWVEKNQMKFTNLNFQNHEIDISTLPDTIEYIGLADGCQNHFPSSPLKIFDLEPIPFLPNLKFASINYQNKLSTVFKDCLNLKEINFYGHGRHLNDIISKNLPWTFSKMHIEQGARILSSFDYDFGVDTIIVHGYLIPLCLQMKHRPVILCNKLVMILNDAEPNLLLRLIKDIHKLQENRNHRDIVVYIGPVKRQNLGAALGQVEKCSLDIQNVLSSNSEEYWLSFEHKVGKSISQAEFDRLSQFSHGYIPLPNYV